LGRREFTTKTLRHEEEKKEEISNFKLQISKGKFGGEDGGHGPPYKRN